MYGSSGGIDTLERSAEVLDVNAACIGRLEPSMTPVEQLDAQRLFKLLHLLRHRGLRDVQRRCGAGETAMIGNGDEVAGRA